LADELAISLLGSGGGVAKAVLSILNKAIEDIHDPLHDHLKRSVIHLIDREPKDIPYFGEHAPNLASRLRLHQFDLRNLKAVREHFTESNTSLVIDVSWADTVEMLEICDEMGIAYVNTALEIASVDDDKELEGFTLIERYRIFEANRSRFTNVKGIIGSGMNPGVVEWMAHQLLNAHADERPLACYIVETDSTFYKNKARAQEKTVYASWSPECFLDEALLNYPLFVQHHVPLILYNAVYEQEFKVTLGPVQFHGCLMPHEEVLSLGRLYDMETGFIYRVNAHTTGIIRDNLHCSEELWDWNHTVLDPSDAELTGEDLVGVLLVYEDKERFMYNVMDNASVCAQYKTNATYFQVACGVYGAACSLLMDEIKPGLYFVDELLLETASEYGRYVSYYLKHYVTGENAFSEGLLLSRMRKM